MLRKKSAQKNKVCYNYFAIEIKHDKTKYALLAYVAYYTITQVGAVVCIIQNLFFVTAKFYIRRLYHEEIFGIGNGCNTSRCYGFGCV